MKNVCRCEIPDVVGGEGVLECAICGGRIVVEEDDEGARAGTLVCVVALLLLSWLPSCGEDHAWWGPPPDFGAPPCDAPPACDDGAVPAFVFPDLRGDA